MLPELLSQIPPDQEIASVTADGAYDTRKCHDAIHCPATVCLQTVRGAERGAAAVIPPRKNAKPWKDLSRFCSGQMLMLCGPLFEGHG